MDLDTHWPQIRRTVMAAQRSALHCAIATVTPQNTPHLVPIGTVFLHADRPGGYMFDHYANNMAKNLAGNPNICLLAVNASRLMWLASFLRGRFVSPPGLRLYGTAGALRLASAAERAAVDRRTGLMRLLPGGRAIWNDFSHVRDLHFTRFAPIMYPAMMEDVWQTPG
jgi:hypothetical protein